VGDNVRIAYTDDGTAQVRRVNQTSVTASTTTTTQPHITYESGGLDWAGLDLTRIDFLFIFWFLGKWTSLDGSDFINLPDKRENREWMKEKPTFAVDLLVFPGRVAELPVPTLILPSTKYVAIAGCMHGPGPPGGGGLLETLLR